MRDATFRLDNTLQRDPAVDAWLAAHGDAPGLIAREWFAVMRKCGDEVRELLHDGCPHACFGNAAFAYVNAFASHVNIGFFYGAALRDPHHLLEGKGKCMRHVKLRLGTSVDVPALHTLIADAYKDVRARA